MAFCMNAVTAESCEYREGYTDSIRNSMFVYCGFIYDEMNRYCIGETKGEIVNDGVRSITNHSNIPDR